MRGELIAELAAASGNLREVSSSGDERRFSGDRGFCFAVVFFWLRPADRERTEAQLDRLGAAG